MPGLEFIKTLAVQFLSSKSRYEKSKSGNEIEKPKISPKLSYANNQCPVCGTIAPTIFMLPTEPLPPSQDGDGGSETYTPFSQSIRCATCSVCFWQDAVHP